MVMWERTKVALRGAKHITKSLCLPLFTILNAIGNPVVDYFSLDVEGSELPILRSVPWEKVTIKARYFNGHLQFKTYIFLSSII